MGVYYVPVEHDHPVKPVPPELPSRILSNCWAWVKYNYPNLPPTATILSHLSNSGEVGVLYYASSDLYHYVRVIHDDGVNVTFDETNFNGHKKSTRVLNKSAFVGFYSL